MVEGLDQLELYFRLLELMLLVALQGQQQFLLLQVVLPELPLLEQLVFLQELLPQLVLFQQVLLGLEQIEGQLLLLGFEFQH